MDLPRELQIQAHDLYVFDPVMGKIREVLAANKPDAPQPEDALHTASAKAFLRSGYELALKELEAICTKTYDTTRDELLEAALDPRD